MQNGTQHNAAGLKVTGIIVQTATAAAPRPKTPRRPWRLMRRMLAGNAVYALERACSGLVRIEGYDRHGIPAKMRIKLGHPMALPAGCIFLAALPFLALWAAIVPVLRWNDRREALRHNAELRRIRS